MGVDGGCGCGCWASWPLAEAEAVLVVPGGLTNVGALSNTIFATGERPALRLWEDAAGLFAMFGFALGTVLNLLQNPDVRL